MQMLMPKGDQPAFPAPNGPGAKGLTVRDYFAAQALAGVLANQGDSIKDNDAIRAIAGFSYDLADAMLEARAQRGAE